MGARKKAMPVAPVAPPVPVKKSFMDHAHPKNIDHHHLLFSVLVLVASFGATVLLLLPNAGESKAIKVNKKTIKVTYTCHDSDGGITPEVRGNTVSRSSFGGVVRMNDFCVSTTTVYEGYCANATTSKPFGAVVECGFDQFCDNGACKLLPPSELTTSTPTVTTTPEIQKVREAAQSVRGVQSGTSY